MKKGSQKEVVQFAGKRTVLSNKPKESKGAKHKKVAESSQPSEEEPIKKPVKAFKPLTAGPNNPLTGKAYSSKYYEILKQRMTLPIWESRERLLTLLKAHQVVILQGETGSGKTTQVPQFLLFSEFRATRGIACTQPRRVAAVTVARRVAEELDVQLGEQVGYSIRFEDRTCSDTVLKYLTDGMLLREAISDPTLSSYDIVLLDEAHERTLATDVLFGLIKEILPNRPEMKVIVMSATIDAEKFVRYFEGAPLLTVSGRVHPVEVVYTEQPEENYYEAAVETAVRIHSDEDEGDILLFLTGEEEIEAACQEIREKCEERGNDVGKIEVYPLYSTLPPQQQQLIFSPPPEKNERGIPGRKCIVATNIAETSITIDGVVYVIDPGMAKQKVYNPKIRVESLLVSPISKASANQRSGRAGRTRPGKCFRLYTRRAYNELQENSYPEVLRCNLSSAVLTLLKLGVKDLVHFDFIDPPAPETFMRALETLSYLGAIDEEGELTQIGDYMAEYPLEPHQAKMLLAAEKYSVVDPILSIIAMLSVPIIFTRPRERVKQADAAKGKFAHANGDYLTYLNCYYAYKNNKSSSKWCFSNFVNFKAVKAADSIKRQLEEIYKRQGHELTTLQSTAKDYCTNIEKCILEGYFMQVAHLQKAGHYLTLRDNQVVLIHPSSVLGYKPEWVLYNEYVLTKRNYIRTVMEVNPEWFFEISKDYFNVSELVESEAKRSLIRVQKGLEAKTASKEKAAKEKVVDNKGSKAQGAKSDTTKPKGTQANKTAVKSKELKKK